MGPYKTVNIYIVKSRKNPNNLTCYLAEFKRFLSADLVMSYSFVITQAKTVCSLRDMFDDRITMGAHASGVVRSCLYQVRFVLFALH